MSILSSKKSKEIGYPKNLCCYALGKCNSEDVSEREFCEFNEIWDHYKTTKYKSNKVEMCRLKFEEFLCCEQIGKIMGVSTPYVGACVREIAYEIAAKIRIAVNSSTALRNVYTVSEYDLTTYDGVSGLLYTEIKSCNKELSAYNVNMLTRQGFITIIDFIRYYYRCMNITSITEAADLKFALPESYRPKVYNKLNIRHLGKKYYDEIYRVFRLQELDMQGTHDILIDILFQDMDARLQLLDSWDEFGKIKINEITSLGYIGIIIERYSPYTTTIEGVVSQYYTPNMILTPERTGFIIYQNSSKPTKILWKDIFHQFKLDSFKGSELHLNLQTRDTKICGVDSKHTKFPFNLYCSILGIAYSENINIIESTENEINFIIDRLTSYDRKLIMCRYKNGMYISEMVDELRWINKTESFGSVASRIDRVVNSIKRQLFKMQ